MSHDQANQVTQLLEKAQQGQQDALDQLFTVIYSELHSLAGNKMRRENPGNLLQTTALVNETYLRLFGGQAVLIRGREHFFRLASSAMRRILVDQSRSEGAVKRGGPKKTVSFEDWMHPQGTVPIDGQIDLQKAIEALSALDARAAQIVDLVLYGGRSLDEIATLLNVTRRTVERDLASARLFLNRHLALNAAHP